MWVQNYFALVQLKNKCKLVSDSSLQKQHFFNLSTKVFTWIIMIYYFKVSCTYNELELHMYLYLTKVSGKREGFSWLRDISNIKVIIILFFYPWCKDHQQ